MNILESIEESWIAMAAMAMAWATLGAMSAFDFFIKTDGNILVAIACFGAAHAWLVVSLDVKRRSMSSAPVTKSFACCDHRYSISSKDERSE